MITPSDTITRQGFTNTHNHKFVLFRVDFKTNFQQNRNFLIKSRRVLCNYTPYGNRDS